MVGWVSRLSQGYIRSKNSRKEELNVFYERGARVYRKKDY